MYTPECSYWITASGPVNAIDKAKTALLMVDTVRDFFLETEWPTTSFGKFNIQYSVQDDLGTISQWTDLEADMANVSTVVPEVTFVVEEIDEETRSFHRRLTYLGGKLFEELNGRTIDPGELDNYTIRVCIEKLEEAGIKKARKHLEELIEA